MPRPHLHDDRLATLYCIGFRFGPRHDSHCHHARKTSSAGLRQWLDIAGLLWEHERFSFSEKLNEYDEDGIIGYTVFQDKVVEIDYDKMVLLVHEALPAHAAGFTKTPMPFAGSLTSVEAVFLHGNKRATGQFIFDTGAGSTMNVNSAFATANKLHSEMKSLGKSAARGVGADSVGNAILLLPELSFAGFTLKNVPVHVALATAKNDFPAHAGTVNVEVLSRFNTILDCPRNTAYFKPNTRFHTAFKTPASLGSWFDFLK